MLALTTDALVLNPVSARFALSVCGPKDGLGRRRLADPDCASIERLEREWRDALCRKDMERLRSLVHRDFLLIGTRSTGPFMMNREEWLDAIQRRDVQDIGVVVKDRTIFMDMMIGTVQAS